MDKKEQLDANSLLSIANEWGEDITPEQAVWLDTEVNDLPSIEQGKFFDLHSLSHFRGNYYE